MNSLKWNRFRLSCYSTQDSKPLVAHQHNGTHQERDHNQYELNTFSPSVQYSAYNSKTISYSERKILTHCVRYVCVLTLFNKEHGNCANVSELTNVSLQLPFWSFHICQRLIFNGIRFRRAFYDFPTKARSYPSQELSLRALYLIEPSTKQMYSITKILFVTRKKL